MEDLGEGGAIAENIWEKHVGAVDVEFIAEILASVKKLADEGFPTGEVAVGFDPHGSDGLPVG